MENEYAFKLSMRKEHGIGMIHANNKFRFSDKLILYHNYQDTLALYTHQPNGLRPMTCSSLIATGVVDRHSLLQSAADTPAEDCSDSPHIVVHRLRLPWDSPQNPHPLQVP